MSNKISKLRDDLIKVINGAHGAIDDRVSSAIGFSIRSRMLSLISKGISPVGNRGRFPEYKGVTQSKKLRQSLRVINRLKSANPAQVQRKKAQLRRSLDKSKKAYPFSVQKDFPSKRPRPVNLFLSGDFLSNLTYLISGIGKKAVIEIGYIDDLSAKKESGHREGVNGQPKRPTIPTGNESFSTIIVQDVAKIVKAALANYFRKL